SRRKRPRACVGPAVGRVAAMERDERAARTGARRAALACLALGGRAPRALGRVDAQEPLRRTKGLFGSLGHLPAPSQTETLLGESEAAVLRVPPSGGGCRPSWRWVRRVPPVSRCRSARPPASAGRPTRPASRSAREEGCPEPRRRSGRRRSLAAW